MTNIYTPLCSLCRDDVDDDEDDDEDDDDAREKVISI